MHSSDNHQLFSPKKPVKMGGESRQGCSEEGVRIVVGSGGGVDGGVHEGGGVGGRRPNSLSRISTSASGINKNDGVANAPKRSKPAEILMTKKIKGAKSRSRTDPVVENDVRFQEIFSNPMGIGQIFTSRNVFSNKLVCSML